MMTPQELAIARQSALETINEFVDRDFHVRGPKWVRTWYALRLDWSGTDRAYVVLPKGSDAKLARMAGECREIFELAMFVVGTRIEGGASIPRGLRTFVARYLKGTVHPPAGKPGRPRKTTWGRDYVIYDVLRDLVRGSDMPAIHNTERTGRRSSAVSASEIVEAAVRESRLKPNLTRRQIEKIWHKSGLKEEHREIEQLRALWRIDEAHNIPRR